MEIPRIEKVSSRVLKVDPTILIIGCGISGIAAAQHLYKHGLKDIRILEANNRSGGRIWTMNFGSTVVDMGAVWLHGPSDDNPIFRLASQYGLLQETALLKENKSVAVWRHPQGITVHYSSTGNVFDANLAKDVDNYFTTLIEQAREFLHMKITPIESVGQFMKQVIISNSAEWQVEESIKKLKLCLLNQWLKVEACISGVYSIDEIALKPYGEFEQLYGLDCVFPTGYGSLIECMMSCLPKKIVLLNKPVQTVHWNGTFKGPETKDRTFPVLVECEDGDTFPADHVIVTVPLGFLKERFASFLKPLPPLRKVHAIQKMGFGTHNKFFLEYEAPFWKPGTKILEMVWEEEISLCDVQPDMQTSWFKKIVGFIPIYQREKPRHVLSGFISGPEAVYMETLTDEEVISCITQLLQQFIGDPSLPRPVRMLRTRWYSERYMRGSYCHMPVGTSGQDIDALAEPLPEKGRDTKPLQVLFAGEATHRTLYTLTQGALLSGRREAECILQHYGKTGRRQSKSKP